jgi:hypothetical protein
MRKQIRHTMTLAGAVVSLFGLASAVQAAPVTYNFTSGTASLSLTAPLVGSLLAPNSIGLDGTQVTFDSTALTVPNFQFVDAGPSGITGAGVLAGTTLTLTNLNIIPGVGYGSSAVFVGPQYNYLVTNVAVSGTYTLSGLINQGPTAFSSLNPSLVGQINLGGVTSLALSGITLGSFTIPASIGPPFGGQVGTLKADILFTGVVPVPAAVWLFGSGLGLLGVMRRRMA